MRPMASRSTFSWDHNDVKADITNRTQNSRTIFFMSGTPGERSNGGLYSVGLAIGAGQIVKLFQGAGIILSSPDFPRAADSFRQAFSPRLPLKVSRPRRRCFSRCIAR